MLDSVSALLLVLAINDIATRLYPIRGHRLLPISVPKTAHEFAGILISTANF
jgi:hypothetical protein